MSALKGKGILSPFQKEFLITFGKVPDASLFYLTGGTALSEFYLGHRRSYDIDLFAKENNLISPFSNALEKHLSSAGYTVNVLRRFELFAEFDVKRDAGSIRVQLAYDSPFRFEPPQLSEFGVNVNDYKDIMVDKLLTFFGRWKHRDAVDLFFILKSEPLESLLQLAKQKDPGFDLYWFCAALKEVEDFPDAISDWPVDMLVPLDARELKDSFKKLFDEMMSRIKKK